jgi:homogentisate 1,2-dioxygenase
VRGAYAAPLASAPGHSLLRRSTMPPYRQVGSIPRKRHIEHRVAPGYKNEGIYYEEVVTTAGFGRASSILYHVQPPTRVRSIEPAGSCAVDAAPQGALRHHHLKTLQIPAKGDPIRGRVPMLYNADVIISRCRPAQPQTELYRNADADEVIFVHKGRGTLLTHFGPLPFHPFDYVVVPRATTYRLEFEPGIQPDLLIIEATGSVVFPPRYLNPDGQLKLGAPFSERDLHGPSGTLLMERDQDTTVLVKDGDRLTRYTLANHPFDVVGWDGFVYPYTFNADDFEPITGTIHQPPPVQQTFEAPGFVICTFAPRMLDTHPEAIKVPYAHSNIQADEVLYYVRGRFGSRRGVEESSFTLHPRGIPHGPHPGTIVASRSVTRTDELAVMVDTVKPLLLTRQAMELDDPMYPLSWLE